MSGTYVCAHCMRCFIAEPHFITDTHATWREMFHFGVTWPGAALLVSVLPFYFIDDHPNGKRRFNFSVPHSSARGRYELAQVNKTEIISSRMPLAVST